LPVYDDGIRRRFISVAAALLFTAPTATQRRNTVIHFYCEIHDNADTVSKNTRILVSLFRSASIARSGLGLHTYRISTGYNEHVNLLTSIELLSN